MRKQLSHLKACVAILLALAAASIVGLQLFFFPALQHCMLGSLAYIGSSLSFNASLARTAASCAARPSLLFLFPPALFVFFLFSRHFFRRFAAFLAAAAATPRRSLFFLTVSLAVLLSFYLAPGDLLLTDGASFQAMTASYAKNFGEGTVPWFSFDWYGGSEHFYYYGPLYFSVAGAVGLLFHDINLASKLLLYVLHIASGITFFMLVRRWVGNAPALLASLLYALAFDHVARIMIVGRFMLAIFYALLPLAVLVLEQLLSDRALRRDVPLLALLVAAIFLASPADALYVLGIFSLYAAIRLLQQPSRQRLFGLAAAALLSFMLVAFWLIPFFVEREFVNGGARVLNELALRPDAGTLLRLFSWPGFWGHSRVYSFGLVTMFFAAFAMFPLRRRKPERVMAVAAAGGAGMLLLLLVSERCAAAALLFLALAAAFGLHSLLQHRRFAGASVLALLFLLVAADVLPATVQPSLADYSYERSFLAGRIAAGNGRVLDLHTTYRTYYASVPYLSTGAQTVFGAIPEGAPRSFVYLASVANGAAQEIYDRNGTLSPLSLDALYLLDVRYIVVRTEQVNVSPAAAFASKRYSFGLERGLRVIELPHSPVIAAPRILPAPSFDSLEGTESFFTKPLYNSRSLDVAAVSGLVHGMQVDRETGSAAAIFVRNHGEEVLGGNVTLQLLGSSVSPSRVELRVRSSSPAVARLSYAYYPWIRATVNGREAGVLQTAMHFAAVRIGDGESTIVLASSLSPSRKLFGIASLLALLGVFALLLSEVCKRIRS